MEDYIEEDIGVAEEEIIPDFEPANTPEYNDYYGSMAAVAQTPLVYTGGDQAVFEQFMNNVNTSIALLEQGNETNLRLRIAEQETQSKIQTLTSVLEEEVSSPTADLALIQGAIELSESARIEGQQDALERMALNNIEDYALSNPHHGAIVEAMMAGPEEEMQASEFFRDQLERRQIMQREASKLSREWDDQEWYGKVFDWLAMLVPLNRMTSVDNLIEGADFALAGTSLKDTQDTLLGTTREEFDRLYPEVYAKLKEESGLLFGDNELLSKQNAEQLLSIHARTAKVENALDFLDLATLGADVATLGGTKVLGGLSKIGLLRNAKAKDLAKTITVNTIEDVGEDASKKALKETDKNAAFDEAQPSAAKTTDEDFPGLEASISNSVNQELAVQEQLAKVLQEELRSTGRLDKNQYTRMVEDARESVKKEYDSTIDFKVDNRTAASIANVILGKTGGTEGWTNKGLAALDAKRKKMPNAVQIQQSDGSWVNKIEIPLNERRYLMLNEDDITAAGPIGRFLKSAANVMPEFLQSRAVQANIKSSRLKQIFKPMMEPLKILSSKEKARLTAVWEEGNIKNKWYNLNEFVAQYETKNAGALPTQKDWLAYQTLKNINDMDYQLLNHDLYIRNFTDGWVTGSIQGENLSVLPTNMKEVGKIDDILNAAIYDARSGNIIEGRFFVNELQDRMTKGEKVYRLQTPQDLENGVFNYVIGNKLDVKTGPLKYNQLDYRAGGHRLYDGQYFVKMAQFRTLKSGREAIVNPKTFVVARTKSEAEDWANRWNDMLDSYKAYKTDSDTLKFTQALERNGYEGSVDDFIKQVQAEKLDTKNRLEVTFGGEEPKAYATLRDSEALDMRRAVGPHESWMEQSGSMYYSRRGKPLKGPQEERAAFVDPFNTVSKAINQNIQKAGFTNYRVTAINSWMETFKDYLPQDGRSASYHFWNSPLKMGGDDTVKLKAETVRQTIKRQIGFKTEQQVAVDVGLRKFAEFVDRTAPSGKVGRAITQKAFNIQSADPVAALKSFAFDLKLGLFDMSQIVVQTQTLAALNFLDPVNAPKMARDFWFIRAAAINQSDEFASYVSKFTSMEKDEFKLFMKELRSSGWLDVGTELVYFDNAGTAAMGSFGANVDRVRELGRIPFYEAERLNRIGAFRLAWENTKNKFDDMTSTEARSMVANLTDKYSMNMTQASGAAWQKGILSIPTQFLSYQARFLENILPVAVGGNKQFSGWEKARLAASQAALYGATGVPLGNYLMDKWASSDEGREAAEDNPSVYRYMVGGLMDGMIYSVTGADSSLAQRTSVIKGWENYAKELMGGAFGDTSFLEVLGGAPVSVLMDVGGDVVDSYHLLHAVVHSERIAIQDVTEEIAMDVLDNVSSLSRLSKMYYGLKYGQYYSGNTGKSMTNVTTPEAMWLGLGIQPREMSEIGYNFNAVKARKETIKGLAEPISKLRLEAFRLQADGDVEGANRKLRVAAAMLSMLDSEDRGAVSQRAFQLDGQTLIEKSREQRWKTTGEVQAE
jgi:hypothetical protein